MRVFKVPFDVKREERIFGGYLSLRQVIYLMLSAASFTMLFLPISMAIKLTAILIISIFFLLCAFFKVNEQNFDKYFFYGLKYLFRKKNFVYERCCK